MPKTPKRPPRNACGRSDNDLRRCLFFVCPHRGRERDAAGPFQFPLCAGACPLRLKNGPGPGIFRVPGESPPKRPALRPLETQHGGGIHHASSLGMTAGLATRSAARTRRAPAAQSSLQIRMCLGQHQGGVPIFGSVAQSPERPFGRPQGPAGRLRAQVTSDPPSPTAERPSKEGRFRFPILRRAIRSAGGVLPDGVKGARRPVKPSVPVRVRVRQPVFRSQGASDLHAAPRRRRFVVQVHVGAPIQMPNAEFGLWNSDASRSFGPLAPIPHSPFRVPHFHVPECKESRSRPFTPGLAGASPAGDTSLMLVMM